MLRGKENLIIIIKLDNNIENAILDESKELQYLTSESTVEYC